MTQSIAFFGLGSMGAGMAGQLVAKGFAVNIWNRTRERAAPLIQRGARVSASPHEAATGVDVLISMVADDNASRAVWLGESGALAAAKSGSVLIECSTLSPVWVRELAAAARGRGCDFLDAPVTGSKTHAQNGELLFLVGGDSAVLDRVRPVLNAMSRDAVHLGPTGSGALMKLINNFVCGVQAAALGEAVAFIEKAGLNEEQALNIMLNGAPGSPLFKAVAPRMTARSYDVHFRLELMQKDLAYAIAEAETHSVPLSTAAAARKMFAAASAQGLGNQDFSAIVESLRGVGRE